MALGLLELVAPQFLIDFRLPDEIHDIVSFLRVAELDSAWDETGVTHWGKATFKGEGNASPVPLQRRPSGELFEWNDVEVEFRLTIPRAGAPDLKGVVDGAANVAGSTSPIVALKATLDRFGAVPPTGTSSDYPGFAFRLELLLSAVTLHLPKTQLVPARLAADGGLEPDPDHDDVRLVLPKVAVVVTRDNKAFSADVDFEGWGVTGLDDDLDPAAGELISMVPPLCLHESGVFGFGLEKAVLDLSADHTPAEILERCGAGDDFRGLWLPHVRIFVAPKKAKGLAFQAQAEDLLIDFREGVSGEFALEVLNRVDGKVKAEPRFFEGDRMILPARGDARSLPTEPQSTVLRGTRASVAADGELQLVISGGLPPYNVTVKRQPGDVTIPETPFDPQPEPNPGTDTGTPADGGGKRVRWLLDGTAPGTTTLNVRVTDSGPAGKVSVWDESIELAVREAGNRIGTTTIYPQPTLTVGDGTPGYELRLGSSQPDPGAVLLQASPAPLEAVDIAGVSAPHITAAGEVRVPVTADNTPVVVVATWPSAARPPRRTPTPSRRSCGGTSPCPRTDRRRRPTGRPSRPGCRPPPPRSRPPCARPSRRRPPSSPTPAAGRRAGPTWP
jgi:hypothetical protein